MHLMLIRFPICNSNTFSPYEELHISSWYCFKMSTLNDFVEALLLVTFFILALEYRFLTDDHECSCQNH